MLTQDEIIKRMAPYGDTELARLSGLARSTVIRIRDGSIVPSIETAASLLDAIGALKCQDDKGPK